MQGKLPAQAKAGNASGFLAGALRSFAAGGCGLSIASLPGSGQTLRSRRPGAQPEVHHSRRSHSPGRGQRAFVCGSGGRQQGRRPWTGPIARGGMLPSVGLSQPGPLHAAQRLAEPGRAGRWRAGCAKVHRQQCGPRVCQPGAPSTRRLGLAGMAGVRRADAASAMAAAELEVSRRGLVAAVTAPVLRLAGRGSQAGRGRARPPGSSGLYWAHRQARTGARSRAR